MNGKHDGNYCASSSVPHNSQSSAGCPDCDGNQTHHQAFGLDFLDTLFVFNGVPDDGFSWRYVARACGRWTFSRLSGSQCWLTVHQYQSPSASWYQGVHKVSSNHWAVGATPQWPDGDHVQGPHVSRTQRSTDVLKLNVRPKMIINVNKRVYCEKNNKR